MTQPTEPLHHPFPKNNSLDQQGEVTKFLAPTFQGIFIASGERVATTYMQSMCTVPPASAHCL